MYDVAIIGAGPAGSSAAIFTAKAGKKTVVFDSDQSITRRAWVKNHYGVKGIDGPDLVDIGKHQAESFGAEMLSAKVNDIKMTSECFKLETDAGEFKAKHVIFTTGLWADLAEKVGLKTKPATEPRIKTIIECDADGRTNIAGIWAAGTVAGVSVHTIITAGDGAKVAVNVISEMNGERYVDHDVLQPKS